MAFFADLHVHSKYSRATSRDCDLEHLAWWARRKGISVVGTGDFTHPAWFEELQEKLVPAEPGLFRLRPELEREVERTLPAACQGRVRFMLEVEVSTIYKKGDRTRKIHHLIYAPDFETASRFRDRLARIGNIASDGRPILGLDSRHLLEIVLESGQGAYLIPAHIWTPWFAVLGSKSGFDSVVECYGDLAGHIFAVETGLSSDPPMNWRVSQLDGYRLVSNSDAHSPPMLGREACVFDTDVDYFAMRRALETGHGYDGTVEFFPEDGKYHLDGHRACGVRLEPQETRDRGGLCPACGKAVTVGVLNRVGTLADRPTGKRPDAAAPFRSLVQLPEIVAELHGVGARSKRVERTVASLVSHLGPELEILERQPIGDVERVGGALLAEALRRLRAGRVRREGGYDGAFGTIRLFEPEEMRAQMGLFALPEPAPGCQALEPASEAAQEGTGPLAAVGPARFGGSLRTESGSDEPSKPEELTASREGTESILARLDPDQRAAAEIERGPLLIIAGPGTGKTRTLTHRIAHLIRGGVAPEACLAVTFTRRAAREMRERLEELVPDEAPLIPVTTFHGLGLSILREQRTEVGFQRSFRVGDEATCLEIVCERFGLTRSEAVGCLADLGRRRRSSAAVGASDGAVGGASLVAATQISLADYRQALRALELVDFDDLLLLPVELLDERADLVAVYRRRYRWISIDEYQDIDALQYRLLRLLAPEDGNVCAIGDPDQSIYRFRGAEVGFFLRFQQDFPAARVVELRRNYRSQRIIVDAALQAIAPCSLVAERRLEAVAEAAAERIVVHRAASPDAEAEFVVWSIEEMLGGTSYFSLDSGRVRPHLPGHRADLSFEDFAVLYRIHFQAVPLVKAFERAGMPFQKRSHLLLMEQEGVRLLVRTMESLRGERKERRNLLDWLTAARAHLAAEATSGGVPQLETAGELLTPLAHRHGADLEAFLSELALGAEVDTWERRAERISLLTLHAAKGLEFPVVFLVGCEDGLLPLTWSQGEVDLDEERRLFFVGMTRARSRLFLTLARRRAWRGRVRETAASPFLRDIEEGFLEQRRGRQRKGTRPTPDDTGQLRLL
ncbi:MAG: UvrD-helicase domain-containing protein [Thermoanaerobaculia bacterium]